VDYERVKPRFRNSKDKNWLHARTLTTHDKCLEVLVS